LYFIEIAELFPQIRDPGRLRRPLSFVANSRVPSSVGGRSAYRTATGARSTQHVPLQFLAIGAQPRRWLPTGVPVRREKAVERIDFRSGVNLGDMIADDDDIFAESMYLSQNGLQVLIRDEAAPHHAAVAEHIENSQMIRSAPG
jgi:hypothetical protein